MLRLHEAEQPPHRILGLDKCPTNLLECNYLNKPVLLLGVFGSPTRSESLRLTRSDCDQRLASCSNRNVTSPKACPVSSLSRISTVRNIFLLANFLSPDIYSTTRTFT